jgi:hypothetical protein
MSESCGNRFCIHKIWREKESEVKGRIDKAKITQGCEDREGITPPLTN